MQPDTETPVENLRPFWGRIMVIPSSVDERERRSGLIVPDHYEGDDSIQRGVVVHVDRLRSEPVETTDDIVPGTVVHYRGGVRVRDTVILERQEIYAYEVQDERPLRDYPDLL